MSLSLRGVGITDRKETGVKELGIFARLFAFVVVPALCLTGCARLLGVPQGLAPEDEPYLFDRSDPSFHLAKPCEDITDEQVQEAGLTRSEDDKYSPKVEGLDDCNFNTEDYDMVTVTGIAYKLAMLESDAVILEYEPSSNKSPVVAYSEDGKSGCSIAAETPRGTVEVFFRALASDTTEAVDDCPNAEKYFDMLIGEKLNEYRAN